MAAHPAAKAIDTQAITDKARRDLLQLLEAVSWSCVLSHHQPHTVLTESPHQVRGKKNLVIEKSLAGTIGLFVKFSTLQEYGVDKVFFLENHNVDASQRNIVFLVRGENAKKVRTVAGKSSISCSLLHPFPILLSNNLGPSVSCSHFGILK